MGDYIKLKTFTRTIRNAVPTIETTYQHCVAFCAPADLYADMACGQSWTAVFSDSTTTPHRIIPKLKHTPRVYKLHNYRLRLLIIETDRSFQPAIISSNKRPDLPCEPFTAFFAFIANLQARVGVTGVCGPCSCFCPFHYLAPFLALAPRPSLASVLANCLPLALHLSLPMRLSLPLPASAPASAPAFPPPLYLPLPRLHPVHMRMSVSQKRTRLRLGVRRGASR